MRARRRCFRFLVFCARDLLLSLFLYSRGLLALTYLDDLDTLCLFLLRFLISLEEDEREGESEQEGRRVE